MSTAARLDACVKQYGATRAVDGLDLAVPAGTCFGLLGPNGAGKTTALRLMLGLTPPTAGTITVLDEPVPARASAMRQHVGVVAQADNLDPDFTVRENLAVYARYFGLTPRRIRDRIERLLAFADLDGRADAPISALSGGMKRRLMLARALVNDPALIVLDEPTTGLDPQARQYIWHRLRGLQAEGRTLILTTHYMEEAERLCERVAIIDHGRAIAEDTPAGLVAASIAAYVLEARGAAAEAALTAAHRHGLACERAEDTTLVYAPAEHQLHTLAAELPESAERLLRRANLEDVFLARTGRDLRD